MKVLFAVSNETISDSIVKKYQKDYKEIISYKNVYYFNAILKEIQNDKSYDRIVISEDLEPFVNTNNDSIDNFIFEHLDKISDEAQGADGKEMDIILICSERRTLGSSILNKLFSIGIYNALIGNDRNMTELCRLIDRPRTKKEAKLYYRIDQATYDPAGDSGEVSESEIQNILNHFKKLGKNTERYADSFNNIAAQYTDEQLKLIINVLPMKVKAVLEADSEKYQFLMGTTGSVKSAAPEVMESGIKVNTIGSGSSGINGPIVIPSGVKRFSGAKNAQQQNNNIIKKQANINNQQAQQNDNLQNNVVKVQRQSNAQPVNATKQPLNNQANNQRVEQPKQVVQPQRPVQNVAQNSQINNISTQNNSNVSVASSQGQRFTGNIAKPVQPSVKPVPNTSVATETVDKNDNLSELLGDLNANEVSNSEEVVQEKRGRGRPRKVLPEGYVPKPKGKRGRPRKNPVETENNIDDLLNPIGSADDNTLPGVSDDVLPGLEDSIDEISLPGLEDSSNEDVLPGLDEDVLSDLNDNSDDTLLPGLDDSEDIEEDDGVLPGLDDSEDNGLLPGLDEDVDDDDNVGDEVDVSSLLAGLDDDNSTLPGLDDDLDDSLLPGLDDSNDEDVLPGLDDNSNNDLLPGLDDSSDDGLLPGLDDSSNDELLPGLDDSDESLLPGLDDDLDDSLLPGLDDSAEESVLPGIEDNDETILPGMGFEDTIQENTSSTQTNYNSVNNAQSSAIESIKPKIDYSMSNLNSLLSKDKKIVTFVGTTKNGTSFLVNNLALLFSIMGINTAILDMTQNRNSYYIFTDSREELRKIAYSSINKLENGYAEGIKFNKNLTVYTALPADGNVYDNAEPILSTLVQNHSLVLIDCDFSTPPAYFASCQEIYLVQSMDVLTIQPLTAFIRDLKFKGAWEPEKARVVINKEMPMGVLKNKMIIEGMSRYNGPDMSVMTDLFNKDMVKACSIPFDEKVYAKYLETMATCKLSLNGYSKQKQFKAKLDILAEMVYPRLNSNRSYNPDNSGIQSTGMNSGSAFSNSTNSTLNKMKNRY